MYWYNYPWGEIWSPQRDKYQVHTHTYTHIYIYIEPPTLNSDFPFIFSKKFVQKWFWYPKKHGLHWIQRVTANSDLWLICVSLACIILLATKQERVKTERKMNSWYRPSPVFLFVNMHIIEHFVLLRKVWATPAMSSFSLLNWTHISTTHPSLLPSLVLCVFTPSSRTKNRSKASSEHNNVACRAKNTGHSNPIMFISKTLWICAPQNTTLSK